jgi:hypothetical protein
VSDINGADVGVIVFGCALHQDCHATLLIGFAST